MNDYLRVLLGATMYFSFWMAFICVFGTVLWVLDSTDSRWIDGLAWAGIIGIVYWAFKRG